MANILKDKRVVLKGAGTAAARWVTTVDGGERNVTVRHGFLPAQHITDMVCDLKFVSDQQLSVIAVKSVTSLHGDQAPKFGLDADQPQLLLEEGAVVAMAVSEEAAERLVELLNTAYPKGQKPR